MFRPGDIVRCVMDDQSELMKGKLYTVESLLYSDLKLVDISQWYGADRFVRHFFRTFKPGDRVICTESIGYVEKDYSYYVDCQNNDGVYLRGKTGFYSPDIFTLTYREGYSEDKHEFSLMDKALDLHLLAADKAKLRAALLMAKERLTDQGLIKLIDKVLRDTEVK